MRHGKYRFIVGFLTVPLLLYLIFVIWPYLQAFQIAMTDWSGFESGMNYIGFSNYDKLIHDSLFWKSLWHNVLLLLVLPLVTLSLGLFLSFMINVGGKRKPGQAVAGVQGSKIYKVIYFFPQVLSIVIVAVLWQFVYMPTSGGAIDGILYAIGVDNPPTWLGDPTLALMCIMAVMVWANVGFYVVLFSAAMGSIPKEIYEATVLDGANRFTTFFKITLPLMSDTVQAGWVYMGILSMDAFAVVQIMSQGPGGPDNSTYVLPLYIYNSAFRDNQAGYASAMGVAMLFVTLLFAVLTFRASRRERIEF